MIEFYNAFISYKHAPLDSKVAESVQRDLEHFHVPHAIRRKTGRSKIERIFRDKDELPITNDLTETISDALTKSEYLIVICSPNTRESQWVPKEIEFFLKTHSRDKVFTVLAGGDPGDVIPDILKHDGDKTVELLSCDYRLPLRRARKEEMPRLAAALIGCSYDELVRRERAYKMKQFVAVSAILTVAAVGFALYMMRSNRKVHEAYLDSLRQQSMYLAAESRLFLNQDKRVESLVLALASLPSNGNPDTPVTPQALSVLADGTFAYQPLSEGSVDAVWDYASGDMISDFAVNPSGSKLAVMSYLSLYVWDTREHLIVFELRDSLQTAEEIEFIDDDIIIIVTPQCIYAYNCVDGQMMWTYDPVNYRIDSTTVHITDDGHILFYVSSGPVLMLNRDGDVENEYCLSDDTAATYVDRIELSPGGDKLAFTVIDTLGMYSIGCYDIASGESDMTEACEQYPASITWTDEDRIVAAFLPGDMACSDDHDSYNLEPLTAQVNCYDASDMSLEWTAFHDCTFSYKNCSFIILGGSGLLGFSCGDRFSAYDVISGDVVYTWDSGDSIVDVCDIDGDGRPVMITRSGGFVRPSNDGSSSRSEMSYEFAGNIIRAVSNNQTFYIQIDQNNIICYEMNVRDEQWEQIPGFNACRIDDCFIDDRVVAVLTEDGDYNAQITLIDPSDNNVIASEDIGSMNEYTSFRFLGVWNGVLYTAATSENGISLIRTDITDGHTDSENLSQVIRSSYVSSSMQDGIIVYLTGRGDYEGVGVYDIDADSRQEFSVPFETFYIGMAPVYDRTMNVIYVESGECDFIVDVSTGEVTRVDMGSAWNGTSLVYLDPVNQHIVISDRKNIVILDRTGSVIGSIDCDGMVPIGITAIDDPCYLAVMCIDGTLYFYDAVTFGFEEMVPLSVPDDYNSTASFEFDHDQGILYVQQGYLTDGVDIQNMNEILDISNCLGHHDASDRFFTFSGNSESGISVGFFRHYTMEDLIYRAQAYLGYF